MGFRSPKIQAGTAYRQQFSSLDQSNPAELSCLAQLLFCVFETLPREKGPCHRLPQWF